MGKIFCYHHSSDLDGKCSGALVKFFLGNMVELIGIDYGMEDQTLKNHGPDDIVHMVDFSLQPFDKMMELKKKVKKLIWIDHHISSIEESKSFLDANLEGIQRDGTGACELVWEYFEEIIECPVAVKLLADYDVWKLSEAVLNFQYGMRAYETDPNKNMEIWETIFRYKTKEETLGIIAQGNAIRSYEAQKNKSILKSIGYHRKWKGYSCIICNNGIYNSQFFESEYDEKEYDLMIGYKHTWLNGQYFTVSLYSTKENIDCSKIAKMFKGGGHKQAAGFQCKKLPWL